jgi:hypothetical protein
MGKAADNEGRKLRGTFFNNIAVGLVVTGIAVPYFASFAYALETNQFVIAVLEGKIRSGSIEFARGCERRFCPYLGIRIGLLVSNNSQCCNSRYQGLTASFGPGIGFPASAGRASAGTTCCGCW